MAYSGGWRPHIESALALNISSLRVAGVLAIGCRDGTWAWWSDGQRMASISYRVEIGDCGGTMRLHYSTGPENRAHSYSVEIVTTPLQFGGQRLWFKCPYSNRRAGKLYKFAGVDKFCARTSVRPMPTYASQRLSGVDRLMQRRWRLRQKLGDSGGLCDALAKPTGMHWKTFEKYERKDLELEGREWPFLAAKLSRWTRKKAN